MVSFDVTSARQLLAVVLCPARAFTGGARQSDEETLEAGRALRPVKAALIRRFRATESVRKRN